MRDRIVHDYLLYSHACYVFTMLFISNGRLVTRDRDQTKLEREQGNHEWSRLVEIIDSSLCNFLITRRKVFLSRETISFIVFDYSIENSLFPLLYFREIEAREEKYSDQMTNDTIR